jgi:hypothetical protein
VRRSRLPAPERDDRDAVPHARRALDGAADAGGARRHRREQSPTHAYFGHGPRQHRSEQPTPRGRGAIAMSRRSELVEQRIQHIVDLMRRGEWVKGETGPELALEWGVSLAVVEDASAESSRVVRREVTDPAKMTEDIAANLYARLANADDRDAAKIADVLSRVVGARAPERHELAIESVRAYDAMTPREKMMWLENTIAQMHGERERVLALLRDSTEGEDH